MRSRKVYQPRVTSRRPVQSCATPAYPTKTFEVNSSEIDITTPDQSAIKGYLAIPDVEALPKSGIILLSDINGQNSPDTRKVADLLASHSFPTLVPDLFRENPWPIDKQVDSSYEAWRALHPVERVRSDISTAVSALRQRGFGNPLGLIGFCFGGGRLMHEISLGSDGVNPDAAVAFYPTRFDPVATGTKAECPLLFISGDSDPLVPMNVIETLRDTLDEKNEVIPDCDMMIVEGAGHAFAHHPKTEEDTVDSELLLNEATAWFRRFLV